MRRPNKKEERRTHQKVWQLSELPLTFNQKLAAQRAVE